MLNYNFVAQDTIKKSVPYYIKKLEFLPSDFLSLEVEGRMCKRVLAVVKLAERTRDSTEVGPKRRFQYRCRNFARRPSRWKMLDRYDRFDINELPERIFEWRTNKKQPLLNFKMKKSKFNKLFESASRRRLNALPITTTSCIMRNESGLNQC